ncbi:hypothetical protein [Okeania sp. SIO2B3]|uniref:hypothetical protein n=1 Tax=Okeania sp. SIO2B3 TaxID=2607784 RepID=UPI0013C15F4D|nr:hypothetical protein [Okeania sp. SIO2B3]NET42698.1 hypothetical protein [Okeania sp. SIO2B3]
MDYPTSLSPFGNTPAEPLNSLGLRYETQLVGWMVTHRVATDAIRYSTMVRTGNFFVIPVYLATSGQYSALRFVRSGTGKSGDAEVFT